MVFSDGRPALAETILYLILSHTFRFVKAFPLVFPLSRKIFSDFFEKKVFFTKTSCFFLFFVLYY